MRTLASRALGVMAVVAATAMPACSERSETSNKRMMTQARRDSAIAASKLPGAGVARKALEVADTAAVRANTQHEFP